MGKISIRKIAGLLGYSPAAISKEIRRNSNKNGIYDAHAAQRRADWRAAKDKNANKRTPFLLSYVQEKLSAYWSPEQISGRLKREFGNDPERNISFKSIYRWIAKDSRKSEKQRPLMGYIRYLRHKRAGKRLSHGKEISKPQLPSITSRPVDDYHGHWECDLVHGKNGSGFILTAVERKSGFLMATICARRTSQDVSVALKELFSCVPKRFFKRFNCSRHNGVNFSPCYRCPDHDNHKQRKRIFERFFL